MTDGVLSPGTWFAAFREQFREDSCVLAAYRRACLLAREGSGESKEWTSVMAVFLANLAAAGTPPLVQDWEWGYQKIDHVWREPSKPDHPVVLIEHEQQRYEDKGTERITYPVQKLLNQSDEALKVLITYEWFRPRAKSYCVGWLRNAVKKELAHGRKDSPRREEDSPGGFVLVVGSYCDWLRNQPDPYPWIAYYWTGNDLDHLGRTSGWNASRSKGEVEKHRGKDSCTESSCEGV